MALTKRHSTESVVNGSPMSPVSTETAPCAKHIQASGTCFLFNQPGRVSEGNIALFLFGTSHALVRALENVSVPKPISSSAELCGPFLN